MDDSIRLFYYLKNKMKLSLNPSINKKIDLIIRESYNIDSKSYYFHDAGFTEAIKAYDYMIMPTCMGTAEALYLQNQKGDGDGSEE